MFSLVELNLLLIKRPTNLKTCCGHTKCYVHTRHAPCVKDGTEHGFLNALLKFGVHTALSLPDIPAVRRSLALNVDPVQVL